MFGSKLLSAVTISLISTIIYYVFDYEKDKYTVDRDEIIKKYGSIFLIISCVSIILLCIRTTNEIVPVSIPKSSSINNSPPF
tara:strand:- start:474 stop:719 length:246 start_codon:yes stop_codon:yes gene_type:complete